MGRFGEFASLTNPWFPIHPVIHCSSDQNDLNHLPLITLRHVVNPRRIYRQSIKGISLRCVLTMSLRAVTCNMLASTQIVKSNVFWVESWTNWNHNQELRCELIVSTVQDGPYFSLYFLSAVFRLSITKLTKSRI